MSQSSTSLQNKERNPLTLIIFALHTCGHIDHLPETLLSPTLLYPKLFKEVLNSYLLRDPRAQRALPGLSSQPFTADDVCWAISLVYLAGMRLSLS